MKRNSRRAGISLVALVITIIVLIILTGAVIVTFMEGGIIDRAKESVFKNDMRTYQEILALKRAENQMEIALGEKEDVEINASTLAEIQEIIPEFKEEYEGIVVITDGELSIGEKVTGEELSSSEELYATWLSDLGIGLSRLPSMAIASYVEVGDYVAYNLVRGTYTISEEDKYNIWNDIDKDNNFDTGEDVIQNQDINWRVLKNDGRQVTLISEEPIENIYMFGPDMYLKGADILDEICTIVYGGRNLKIEDVNEILKGDRNWGEDETNWIYWGTDMTSHNMPEGVKNITQLQASGAIGVGEISSINATPEGSIEEYILNECRHSKNSFTDLDDIKKDLIFTNNQYFLSSTCAGADFYDSCINFSIYVCGNINVSACSLFRSRGEANDINNSGLRPVVVLNSDVQVANETAGGDTVDTAWQLK